MTASKHLRLSLLPILLLAACVKVDPVAVKSPGKPKTGGSPKVPGSAKPSPDPLTPPATALQKLMKPAGDKSVALDGQIALDLTYATQVGKGQFISDQGGGVVQVAGSPLLSDNGGGLVSDQGGNLIGRDLTQLIGHDTAGLTAKVKFISDQGGGFISDQGGGLISDYGSGLVANNGGGIIANNGGGIVANNSGGLIANNGGGLTSKAKFGLLGGYGLGQAPAATGSERRAVPISGMLVGLLSLRSGAYLPIGVDEQGKAVYAIYTDAQGRYKLNVPKDVVDNVLVVSSFPKTTDPGLAVDLLTRLAGGGTRNVDDSTTVLTAYLRLAIVARLEEITVHDPCSFEEDPGQTFSSDAFRFAVESAGAELKGDAFKALPRASRLRVLTRFADATMSQFGDLETAPILSGLAERYRVTGGAMAALRDVLRQVEAAAARKLAADPTYFDDRPYVQLAKRLRPLEPYPLIRKPSDMSEFLVRAFLTSSGKTTTLRMDQVLVELGLDTLLMADFQAAAASLMVVVATVLTAEETAAPVKVAVTTAIADEQAAPRPAAPACPPAAQPPPVDAETTSWGTGDGAADGPIATAQFHQPARLLLDPQGFLLVAEASRIRKIDLKAAGNPVSTVAGGAETGLADGAGGPAGPARFDRPLGMALDAAGNLYVADADNHAIRKIAGYAGAAPVVSTLAGGGPKGLADGQGAAARFSNPTDLALGADGKLYVVDADNRLLRRLTLDGTASFFAGSSLATAELGQGATAVFTQPRGLALAPDGRLLVTDQRENAIRVVGPDASAGQLAGSRYDLADASGNQVDFRDGTWWTARFKGPTGLAIAPDGAVIVADTRTHRVRRLDPDGWVSTIAGGGALPVGDKDGNWQGGFAEGPAATSRLDAPGGVAVGPDGTIYVADTGNHRIRVIKRR